MSDAREAASSKELSEDDYPGFAADTVLEFKLASDLERLGKCFLSLKANHDNNGNGVLEVDELQWGMFQKNHDTPEEAIANKYFLTNFADLKGLSRHYNDPPAVGIGAQDIAAIGLIDSASTRDSYLKSCLPPGSELRSNKERGESSFQGATVGLAAGLLVSGAALVLMKVLPPKVRGPLALAAAAIPCGGFIAGGFVGEARYNAQTKSFLDDKAQSASKLIEEPTYGAITAKQVFSKLLDERLERLSSQASDAADVDSNGFIDSAELKLAIMTKTGDQQYNKFLSRNYTELELLSRDLQSKDTERGISPQAIELVTNPSFRSTFAMNENLRANQLYRTAVNKYSNLAVPVAIGTAGLCAVAGKFVPSKYQGLYIAASAMSVVGSAIGTPMIGSQLETSGNSQFLRHRENALDRLIHRM